MFSFFTSQSLNASGAVAFRAGLDAGGSGIFATLPGGGAPFAVVQTGDSLFGSTVSNLNFFRDGLGDSNLLAFKYDLADGRQGIAVAQITAPVVVPEPGTVVLSVGCWVLSGVPPLTGVGLVVKRRRNS